MNRIVITIECDVLSSLEAEVSEALRAIARRYRDDHQMAEIVISGMTEPAPYKWGVFDGTNL